MNLFHGKILHINLSERTTTVESPDQHFYRNFWGGASQGLYFLLNKMKAGIDAFDPENLLCISPGISGVPASGFCRFSVQTKSPLMGGLVDSQAGGFFGPELHAAGWDGLTISGRASTPVYLYIADDEVEIRDASHLWGQSTGDAETAIRTETNEANTRVCVIGPGGENRVRFACLVNERKHINGRGGAGAVMGSKNLKAIAVNGTKGVSLHDQEAILDHAKWFTKNSRENPDNANHQLFGTSVYVNACNEAGILPTHNFQTGYLENADATISGEIMLETMGQKHKGCWKCTNRCKSVVETGAPRHVDPNYGGPEYETLASLGSNLGITDLEAISKGNELCNRYSLDTISTGVSIAWAMECFEKGIITTADTDGLELEFGNAEAMLQTISDIAYRRGFGNVLAEGVARASKKLGRGSEEYAMHSKGVELPMHDPRGKGMLAISFGCSDTGADHTRTEHDTDFDFEAPEIFMKQAETLGILERMDAAVLNEKKIAMYGKLWPLFSAADALGLCFFVHGPVRTFPLNRITQILSAATGWEVSLAEIMRLGERRMAMARCFNARQGITAKDDTLPKRLFEPLKSGPAKGNALDKDVFEKMKRFYYEMSNWDPETGIPNRSKLFQLDLDWLADSDLKTV